MNSSSEDRLRTILGTISGVEASSFSVLWLWKWLKCVSVRFVSALKVIVNEVAMAVISRSCRVVLRTRWPRKSLMHYPAEKLF